jgi:hypothetical protein
MEMAEFPIVLAKTAILARVMTADQAAAAIQQPAAVR